jgi:hypothetical protein
MQLPTVLALEVAPVRTHRGHHPHFSHYRLSCVVFLMTTLTKLAEEIKDKADKQVGSFDDFRGSTPARISALMDVVLELEKAVRFYSDTPSYEFRKKIETLGIGYEDGRGAREALRFAEERLKCLSESEDT